MGMTLIYGMLFLLILLLIGIALFVFSLNKKSTIGVLISMLLIIPITLFLSVNTIDELSISKKDVISDLKHLNIHLKDNFKIIDNTVTGMPERIQETEVEVSENDKNRIIEVIRNSTNFKSFENEHELATDTTTEQFYTNDKIFNFKYPEFYSREISKKIDRIPTRIFLTIYDKSNVITYQRIED